MLNWYKELKHKTTNAFNKIQFISTNLLRVYAPGCHPKEVSPINGIQAQYAKLGTHCPQLSDKNIKILKVTKLTNIKLKSFDTKTT